MCLPDCSNKTSMMALQDFGVEAPMKRSIGIATAPSLARHMQVLSPIEWGEQQLAHWESLAPATKHWIVIDTILLLGGTLYTWIGT